MADQDLKEILEAPFADVNSKWEARFAKLETECQARRNTELENMQYDFIEYLKQTNTQLLQLLKKAIETHE